LPPKLRLAPGDYNRVSEVSNLLGRLDGIARTLPDPTILIRSLVRREAQLSSYIENTFARFDEIAFADREERGSATADAQVIETLNAERAILAGVDAVFKRHQPITNGLIRQMHEVLLTGVRGHETRGRFREVQVYIGNHSLAIDGARFVPAPSHLLPELMERFESYLTGDDDLPALLQIGLLHYQFESIHPFEDGNGRLGRILVLLGLCRHELLSVPLLNASLHFERNRQAYYDALLRVSTHGDWSGWLSFFLEGLRVAVIESMQKLTELLSLQREYHNLIRSARNSSILLTLVDNLFISPVVTIPQAAELMDVSWTAANTSVQKLVGAGILRAQPSGKTTRYVADTVLKAVNAEPTRR
jgi:Fic family protein